MVEYSDRVTAILKATSDSTRRDILTLLCQQGACRVTELASHFEMSLNAVSKHIKVLESAGLVQRKTFGRVHMIEADLNDFKLIEQWFEQLTSIWSMRLGALKNFIGETEDE